MKFTDELQPTNECDLLVAKPTLHVLSTTKATDWLKGYKTSNHASVIKGLVVTREKRFKQTMSKEKRKDKVYTQIDSLKNKLPGI